MGKGKGKKWRKRKWTRHDFRATVTKLSWMKPLKINLKSRLVREIGEKWRMPSSVPSRIVREKIWARKKTFQMSQLWVCLSFWTASQALLFAKSSYISKVVAGLIFGFPNITKVMRTWREEKQNFELSFYDHKNQVKKNDYKNLISHFWKNREFIRDVQFRFDSSKDRFFCDKKSIILPDYLLFDSYENRFFTLRIDEPIFF